MYFAFLLPFLFYVKSLRVSRNRNGLLFELQPNYNMREIIMSMKELTEKLEKAFAQEADEFHIE